MKIGSFHPRVLLRDGPSWHRPSALPLSFLFWDEGREVITCMYGREGKPDNASNLKMNISAYSKYHFVQLRIGLDFLFPPMKTRQQSICERAPAHLTILVHMSLQPIEICDHWKGKSPVIP